MINPLLKSHLRTCTHITYYVLLLLLLLLVYCRLSTIRDAEMWIPLRKPLHFGAMTTRSS